MSDCEAYDGADFYDCGDPETLTHADERDAVDELLQDAWETGETEFDTLHRIAPIEVNAYKRIAGPDSQWIAAFVAETIERLERELDEDFGGPDGEGGMKNSRALEIEHAMNECLVIALADFEPWRCDLVTTRTYTADQLAAMGFGTGEP